MKTAVVTDTASYLTPEQIKNITLLFYQLQLFWGTSSTKKPKN
jgi:hypothetical protein